MSISSTDLFVNESPITVGESDEPIFNIELTSADGTAVTLTDGGNLSMEVYKNGSGSDIADSVTTGSLSVSGNVLTSKTFNSLVGGNRYVAVFIATVNGLKKTVGKLELIVERNKTGQ